MAAFREVFRRSGVDERRTPPGMVIRYGSSNIVALIDPGKKLKIDPNSHALDIKEIDGGEIRRQLLQVRVALSEPDTDKQLQAASMPATFDGDARFFEIKGRKKEIGFPGLEVMARTPGGKIEARIFVAVLKEKAIKVAFRNVMIPGSGSVPAFHAKNPCSEQNELLVMNSIWRSQAAISFELVPSEWLVVDDSLPSIKKEIADAVGMKDASHATLPAEIDVEKMKGFFAKHKVKGAHLTVFCVDKLRSASGGHPQGAHVRGLDMVFISSQRGHSTSAHEAGHFLGYYSTSSTKQWDSRGHTLELHPKTQKVDQAEDIKMLMREGGAGWKIPYDLVKEFRDFPAK